MQTCFTLAQLADPDIQEANSILRACVHCGFCTATCPTYALLGDELDGPRGRIYMIKDMLESQGPAPAEVVTHIDRCLSCLSCMTTCPSGVNYMHLVDHARVYVARTHRRPLPDRMLRALLATVLPRPGLFRAALIGARLALPAAALMPGRLKAMLRLAPKRLPKPSTSDRPGVYPAGGQRTRRVALMTGCAQRVLAPEINDATIRLLTRHGCEVVVAKGAGCCGALTHHMGMEKDALASARANIAAWISEMDGDGGSGGSRNGDGLDAIVINASGCGTTVKDYGFMFRNDPDWAERAARVSAIAKDISEVVSELDLRADAARTGGVTVAYQSACSLQHGQKITGLPKQLLEDAGFTVRVPAEAHLCCGSAGTYNIMQPDIAGRLRERKAAALAALEPDVIASGNIGCMTQIGHGTGLPIAHTVELLDWATGGPKPAVLGGG